MTTNKKPYITIVDYGMGNIHSVESAYKYLGVSCQVSSNADIISKAKQLLLPGVGSFKNAMMNLKKIGLDSAIKDSLLQNNGSILGICLGMQLLADVSFENGETPGLGLIQGKVQRLKQLDTLKIPHVGFNQVNTPQEMQLTQGLAKKFDAYFVHSFALIEDHADQQDNTHSIATTYHGQNFVAAYQCGSIFATQFHPEKSQANGLQILLNYAMLSSQRKPLGHA